MPNYSLTRTNKYTSVVDLELLSHQTTNGNPRFDGYPEDAYCSSFKATLSEICPLTNKLWDYKTPSTPVSHYVWYPYSMTLACSGGGVYYNGPTGFPQTNYQYRAGYAYFKLYTSSGTYLMGSTAYALTNASGDVIDQYWNQVAKIESTTHELNNSRNTLTIIDNTEYCAGVVNPSSGTFWTIFPRIVQSGQNVYEAGSVTMTGNMSVSTILDNDSCQLGYITYNNAPIAPTIVSFVTTTTGIRVTCRGDESDSLSSGSIGAVSRVMFFYSTTSGGTYNYLGVDTSITRTLVSGTTYQYVAEVSGGTTLQQGHSYYFKVATVNDVCIQYNSENSGSRAGSALSATQSSPSQYGTSGFVKVYNGTTWNAAPVYVYNGTTWVANSSAISKSDGSGGWIYN